MSQARLKFPDDIRVIFTAAWRYRMPLVRMVVIASLVFVALGTIFPFPSTEQVTEENLLAWIQQAFWVVLVLQALAMPFLVAVTSLGLLDVMRSGHYRPRFYLSRLWDRLLPLTAVLVISAVIVGVGYQFFVLPGYILSFFVMYAPMLVLVDGHRVGESLKLSFAVVGRNFWPILLIMFAVFLPVVTVSLGLSGVLAASTGALQVVLTFVITALNIALATSFHALTYMRLFPHRPAP